MREDKERIVSSSLKKKNKKKKQSAKTQESKDTWMFKERQRSKTQYGRLEEVKTRSALSISKSAILEEVLSWQEKSHFTFKLTRRCQVVNADYLLVIVDPLVTVHEDGCHARGGAVDGNN